MNIEVYGATDAGVSKAWNEDSYGIDHLLEHVPEAFDGPDVESLGYHLAVVADGVSSSADGAAAATTAVQILGEIWQEGAFRDISETEWPLLCDKWMRRIVSDPRFAGGKQTTLSMVAFADARLLWYNIGDSPILLYRADGQVLPLYEEHNLAGSKARHNRNLSAAEKLFFPWRRRIIREEDAFRLLKCLRSSPSGQVDSGASGIWNWAPGDAVLIASDGITRELGKTEIGALIRAKAPAERMVQEAVHRGGQDNCTAIVLRKPERGGNED